MESISVIDVIFIAGVSQGLFLALSLQFLRNNNKEANRILVQILLLSVLMLLGNLLSFHITSSWAYSMAVLADIIIFLAGPLVYIYVRRLAFKEVPRYRLLAVDYLLPVFYLGYFIWFISTSNETLMRLHEEDSLSNFYVAVELLGICSFGWYLLKSFRLLKVYKTNRKDELSNPQGVAPFLKTFLITLTIGLVFWAISFMLKNFGEQPMPYFNYSSLWVTISFFIYVVGFYSLRQPNIFRIPYTKNNVERDRLKPEEINQLKERLEHSFKEDQVYLNPEITLSSLAEQLTTSSNNLSWLLNNVYHTSFSDYINMSRIEAFLKKIEKGEHEKKTLLALAMEVGFNSKSNFNKVFKAQMGDPPSAYIKKKNVA